MACYKTHGVSHQLIRDLYSTGFGTDSACLHGNPFLQHTEYVVPPHDIGFKNLARTGIENRRPHSVGFGRSSISKYGIIHIIHIYYHAVRHFFGNNSILKTRTFESNLPVFYTLLDVFTPTIWSRIFDIEHDRLGRFYQLSTQITFAVFRFRFQTPTGNELLLFYLLLAIAITQQRISEISDTGIIQTACHRLFRKQHQRRAHLYRNIYGSSSFGHFRRQFGSSHHVIFKRFDGKNTRQVLYGRRTEIDIGKYIIDTRLRPVVNIIHFNHHRGRVVIIRFYFKTGYQRRDIVVTHRLTDSIFGRRKRQYATLTNQQFIGCLIEFKAHHLIFIIHSAIDSRFVQFYGNTLQFVHNQQIPSQ